MSDPHTPDPLLVGVIRALTPNRDPHATDLDLVRAYGTAARPLADGLRQAFRDELARTGTGYPPTGGGLASCVECWAVTRLDDADAHTQWHQRQQDQLAEWLDAVEENHVRGWHGDQS